MDAYIRNIIGFWQSFVYTPKDMFWGQLGGALEAIDCGTTFVLDHAHGNQSNDHGKCSTPMSRDSLEKDFDRFSDALDSPSSLVRNHCIWDSLHICIFSCPLLHQMGFKEL